MGVPLLPSVYSRVGTYAKICVGACGVDISVFMPGSGVSVRVHRCVLGCAWCTSGAWGASLSVNGAAVCVSWCPCWCVNF